MDIKTKKTIASLIMLSAMLLFVGAASSTEAECNKTDASDQSAAALEFVAADENKLPDDTKQVLINQFTYQPAEIRIEAGTTVVWINKDPAGHNVAFSADNVSNLDEDLAGEVVGQEERLAVTFHDKGEYPYFCTPHPFMKATVIVE